MHTKIMIFQPDKRLVYEYYVMSQTIKASKSDRMQLNIRAVFIQR